MAESPAERNARLTQHAASMRAIRSKKARHVCPSNELDALYSKLMRRMERYAKNNVARMPIAISWEGGVWYVDLHVWIKGDIEYSIEGEGETLRDALSNACKRLARQWDIRQDAHRDATTFHLVY
jgi:hypothetical protein